MGRSVTQGSSFWTTTDKFTRDTGLFCTNAFNVESDALILSKWHGDGDNINGLYKSLLWNQERYVNWEKYLQWRGDGHLISVAPTRSGKGVGCVVPNLLNYSGSVVVIDPKGENYEKTWLYRKRVLKQQIVCLDPFSIVTDKGDSDVFNPLDSIIERRYFYSDADIYELNPVFDADVSRLAETLVVRQPDEKDPHWNDKAVTVLRALITLTIFRTGLGFVEHWDLAALREYMCMPAKEFRNQLETISSMDELPSMVRRAANEILAMGENELMSVLSTVNRHIEFLDTPCVASVLGRDTENTFSFETLNDPEKRISIYIVIPPHYFTRYSRLVRLWISMAIDVVTHRTPSFGAASESSYPPVLFLLDEMAQLGRMEPIKQAVSLMAGYGMTLWMIIQDLAQMQGLYKEDWQTFLANARIQQFFGINDTTTAKMISEMLGSATYSNVIETESTQGSHFFQTQTTDGLNRNDAGRNLFTPDEIRRLRPEIMLMFVQGMNPILAQKIRYYDDTLFKPRASK